MPITPITVEKLTEATASGEGVFDVLMRALREQLDIEYNKNRIRGPEYSQVFLTSLQSVLQQATAFLLTKDRTAYEVALIEAQVELAKQQAANAVIEGQNLLLQGELLAAQKQNLDVERAFTQAKTAQTTQETLNLVSTKNQIDAQVLQIEAQTAMSDQQRQNAIVENQVLQAQKCKLDAEYDLTVSNVTKSGTENSLLQQKVVSERAQTQAVGVDPDSVIGKQKALYAAQTAGFARDAEQKAAKLLADTWSSRRMTDEATVADGTNMLNDAAIGRAINKLLTGVGA